MMKASTKTIFGLALAGVALAASNVAMAERAAVSTDGGLKVYEGDFWFKLNGRVQFDQTFFGGDIADRAGYHSGSNIRRAELTTKGGFNSDWSYKLQLGFTNDANATSNTRIQEAFVAYVGLRDTTIALGQISAPFGLENWTSTDALTFMEPSTMTYAFTPEYGLGVYADYVSRMFTVAAAVYHPAEQAPSSGTSLTGEPTSDQLGMSARVTFSPVHTENDVWHFGVSGLTQDVEAGSTSVLTVASIPEAYGRAVKNSVSVAFDANTVNSYNVLGAEAAWMRGPVSLQGEYQQFSVERTGNLSDVDFHGYYVQATYTLTGESRVYDFESGTFANLKPRMPCGAWELAARYSRIELDDTTDNVTQNGLKERNVALGVNWYVNNNLKFQADYTAAKINTTAADDKDLDILALRAQVSW